VEVMLAVVADYANVTADGKLNILGTFDEINPPELPFALPQLYLVLACTAGAAEVGSTKDLRIVLLSADGKEIMSLTGQFDVPGPRRPGTHSKVNQILGMGNLPFEKPGDYSFEVLIGGETKASVLLHVNPPPGD
jgi:hypothetical protein